MTGPASIEAAVADWDGRMTVVARDAPTGAWIVVAVHSTVNGRSAGGCRMRGYPSPAAAVVDGQRLSAAMTRKLALCGVPMGGGKSVLAVPAQPTGAARTGLLRRFGELLESLGGLYSAAVDMNTSPEDMDVIGETTSHVFCRTEAFGGRGTTAPATAVGVYHGVRATLAAVTGSDDPAGRRVAVQGVGAVGADLAERLAADGAEVVVADLDPDRVAALVARLGVRAVPPDRVLGEECDVLAPCAAGGVVGPATVPALRCRAVAGAANNQLETVEDAERLHAAGILWAPDYVINSGGVLHGAGLELLGWSEEQLADRLRGIGTTLTAIFERSAAENRSPLAVAEDLVQERLAARA